MQTLNLTIFEFTVKDHVPSTKPQRYDVVARTLTEALAMWDTMMAEKGGGMPQNLDNAQEFSIKRKGSVNVRVDGYPPPEKA